MRKFLLFVPLTIVLFSYLISCSLEKSSVGQEIFVEVSPKIKVYYAETDMTSHYPFPYSTFLDSTIMLSYNIIRNAIDTLYFEGDTLKIKAGNYLEKDGPRKVEGVINIVKTSFGLLLFNAKNIMIDKDGVSDIVNNRLLDSPIFEGNIFYGLNHGVSFYLDHVYKGYNQDKESLYFFVNDVQTGSYFLCEFSLVNRQFKKLPNFVNENLIKENNVKWRGKLTLSKNHMPFIFYFNERLFLSYNYSNEIVTVDVLTQEVETRAYKTNLFQARKKLPKTIPDDIDLLEATALIDEWDFDVSYGSLVRLPNEKGFCRLVRGATLGEEKTDPQLFLEVFDNDLEKLAEIDLTELEPDLSSLFFPNGGRLFFKAKNQENENYLNYYWLEVDF